MTDCTSYIINHTDAGKWGVESWLHQTTYAVPMYTSHAYSQRGEDGFLILKISFPRSLLHRFLTLDATPSRG